MNEWGRMLARYPAQVQVLRYCDLQRDAKGSLARTCSFFDVAKATPKAIERAVEACKKEKMAVNENPDVSTTVVRLDGVDDLSAWFTPENEAFFIETCRKYLVYDPGYGYLEGIEAYA